MLINEIIRSPDSEKDLNSLLRQELEDKIGSGGRIMNKYVNLPQQATLTKAAGYYASGRGKGMTVGMAVDKAIGDWHSDQEGDSVDKKPKKDRKFSSAGMDWERSDTKLKRGWNQSTHRNKSPDVKLPSVSDIADKVVGVKQAKTGKQTGSSLGQKTARLIRGKTRSKGFND